MSLNARQRKFRMSSRAAQIDSLRSLLLQGQSLTTGLLSLGKGKGVAQRRETVSCGEGGARNDLPCRGRMGLLQRKSRAISKDGCVAVLILPKGKGQGYPENCPPCRPSLVLCQTGADSIIRQGARVPF